MTRGSFDFLNYVVFVNLNLRNASCHHAPIYINKYATHFFIYIVEERKHKFVFFLFLYYNIIVRVSERVFNMQGIIVAIISGLCVAIPSVIATISSNKRNNDLVIYRIEELDKRVSAHNNLIDRMYKVEGEIKILNEKLSEIGR